MESFIKQSIDRTIPLLCCVCPKAPQFSDVSHLLTHIASKGHLHHETQMKLRSHQDLTAAVALQKYDQWYIRNNIEDLLVQRMKAKQTKEAARQRRKRKLHTYNPFALHNVLQTTDDPNQIPTSNIKVEGDKCDHRPSIYPDLVASDNDFDNSEFYQQSEVSKLKGQYWPGMGKMDLANEDMKRTRNQRKPKSSVDRMKRTSESIAPTQVVLNLDFEVEVVKGVYDPSSPVPIDEETAPVLKVSRPRRKKTKPLQELPSNVPTTKRRKSKDDPSRVTSDKPNSVLFDDSLFYKSKSPIDPFITTQHTQFHNENVDFGVYHSRQYSSPSMSHSLYPYGDTLSVSDFNLISHPPSFSHSTSSLAAPASSDTLREKTPRIGNHYLSQDGQEYLGQSYLQSNSPYNLSSKNRTYATMDPLHRPDMLNPCLTSNQYRTTAFNSRNSPGDFFAPPPEQDSPFLGATSNNPLYISQNQRYRQQISNHLDNTHQLFAPSIFGSLSRSHCSDDVFGKSEEEYSPTPRESKRKMELRPPTEIKEESELTGNPWADTEMGVDCGILDGSKIDINKEDAVVS